MVPRGELKMMNAWLMTGPGEPLVDRELPLGDLDTGEILVEVAGCGVCHTDISFLHMGVKTRAELPLALGHEVSGTVIDVGPGVNEDLRGRPVLIPAVLPCGECELCRAGHRRVCRKQIMPGNDRHGGFASHLIVPSRFVAPVGEAVLKRNELWELSIVADAMSTPFQAARRAEVQRGDCVVVIGAGGIGIHAVQICAALGAIVIVLDIDQRKVDFAAAHGAVAGINVSGLDVKGVKGRVAEASKAAGATSLPWKIFEMSGTKPGQETAFGLIGFGSTVSIVGFTMDRVEVRLSNLMAFDATIQGNWGCDPLLYPEILDWIAEGRLAVSPHVEKHPLSRINEVMDAAHKGELAKRAVMVP